MFEHPEKKIKNCWIDICSLFQAEGLSSISKGGSQRYVMDVYKQLELKRQSRLRVCVIGPQCQTELTLWIHPSTPQFVLIIWPFFKKISFLFLFCASVVQNSRDYHWRQADIDFMGDYPQWWLGSRPVLLPALWHAVAQFCSEILPRCIAPIASSKWLRASNTNCWYWSTGLVTWELYTHTHTHLAGQHRSTTSHTFSTSATCLS